MSPIARFFARDGVNFALTYLTAVFFGAMLGSGFEEWQPAYSNWFGLPLSLFIVLAAYSARLRRQAVEGNLKDLTDIKAAARAQLTDLQRQMSAWNTMITAIPDGAIVGRVLIVPNPDGESGSMEIEVKEKTPNGGWMDLTEHGPVAVVLTELAEELRRRAMNDATED